MRYQENPQMQKDFQRKCCKENPDIKIEYQKKGTNKMLKLIKNIKSRDIKKIRKVVTRLTVSCNKQNKVPIIFAQYVIEACINVVSDCVSMKNIIFSCQNCIIQ